MRTRQVPYQYGLGLPLIGMKLYDADWLLATLLTLVGSTVAAVTLLVDERLPPLARANLKDGCCL
jgi:hypothetical protein